MKPFFSVIIPLYNKERHIKNTLESVLAQTFQDFEVLVVNDGSTDHSESEANAVTDDRIQLFTIENHGVSFARNHGVSKSNSDFIVLLDADDYWHPHHLENLKNLYSNFPNCGMYGTAYNYQFNRKTVASVYNQIPTQAHWQGVVNDFFVNSTINCIASASTVMIPKRIYESLGGFNTHYDSGEDIDFWIRIALQHDVAFTNAVSATINMNVENQASQKNINNKKLIDFDVFKEEITNRSLQTYLDLNRFSIAIQHIIAGNTKKAKDLIKKIDKNNLNAQQRFLLQMNAPVLKLLMRTKNLLRNNGIGLSPFR
ncbi:MAG: glycosyltransferase family 2 protein [Gelidibacter sp.]